MNKYLLKLSSYLLIAITYSIFLFSCKQSPADFEINKDFQKHISSFSSGVLSIAHPITIQLVEPNPKQIIPNEEVEENLFKISPSVKGKTVWINQHTVQFIPEEYLESGKEYWIEFNLGKVASVPKELKTFKFPFKTIKQAINFEADGLKSYSNEFSEWYQFTGLVYTADVIDEKTLRQNIEAKVNGKNHTIKWDKIGNNNLYTLILDSVPRQEKAGEIIIQWNSLQSSSSKKEEAKERIPSLSDFEILNVSVVQHPEQYAIVRFSDPLLASQNLNGLIEIIGETEVRTAVSTNELRVYPSRHLEGVYTIKIHESVKNVKGYSLENTHREDVSFEAIKPAVRLVGKGSILPSSNNMMLQFEAVNLKAVDIRIVKIFENNIIQFFQSNDFDGSESLKRVGRLIRKKTVYLDKGKPVDLGKWNRFNLDLSEYITVEQGAIYSVEIDFRKYQSTFPCNNTEEDENLSEMDYDERDDSTSENWDYVNDWNADYYNYEWYYDYNYSEREDPCSNSYYVNNSVKKNIFATDIGIIAKKGTNHESQVIVTNIVSATPIEGAEVNIYDYQQQLIGKTLTDKDGMAKISSKTGNPFFILVEHNKQKGYLRLGDANALQLSRFDISGASTQEGLKGYFYGERGVWRPGDTLFLNFILEDQEGKLPSNHPVIFELFNARGQLVKREVQTSSLNGFYNFTSTTTQDAPTGNWHAKVEVGGATFNKTLKVETIKPNRLKINLDIKEEIIDGTNPFIEGDLTVNWLHGAPAKELKTNISVNLIPTKTVFSDFKKYTFDDPSKPFYFEEQLLLNKQLNAEGKLHFRERLEVRNQSPGMLKAIFTTRTFERGGDFSIDQKAINYAPYSHFVGIQLPESNSYGALETDTSYHFPLISVDKHGKASGNRRLNIEVYRIEWSWWWNSGENNIGNYINRRSVTPIYQESVTTNANGVGSTSLRIDKHDWGRYYILVKDIQSGHSAGVTPYFDWPMWMSRSGRESADGANMLTFSSDKKEYTTGEKAKISFPSPDDGRALVSIENGSKVIDAFWIKTNAGETSFELPITPELAPNCYVHITLLQPHSQTKNDAPIRMYGISPILVSDPNTILVPEIDMPDELSPNSKFTIKVNEKNKRDMTYTIAVVDEGLLDLTRFKTPNPWNHFYAREALGVKTWDLFDHVIGAYGAKIENILTIGGDESLNPGEETPIRFKPMVRFIGPFSLKGGKTASHTIDVPNYIGSVRTMVVAGQNRAYGSAEKTTPVKKPLMILSSLPRVLGPKEKVQLPVNVFAMDKQVKNVNIQVKTNDLVKVVGSAQKQVSFNREGDQLVSFDIEVGTLTGAAKIEIVATSAGEKATEVIELEVRHPNLPQTVYSNHIIEENSEWNGEIQLPGMENSNTAVIELSTIPAINLEKRLGYLIRYPHGCIEQRTSGAFPQLYLASLIDIDAKTKQRIDNNVRSVINDIQKHQLADGGFSFWRGGRTSDDWGTSYAGHFILAAEKKGYALPYGLKEKWINYQKNQARVWSPINQRGYRNSDLSQAYRLYTLALANEPLLSAMNKLRAQKDLSVQASWRLAAAYQIIGRNEVAKEIVKNKTTAITPYTELSYTYGNDIRDKAMIIEALTLMGEKAEAARLVREISEELSKDKWMSTQTTAYSLMAVALFTENNKPKGGMKASYTYNGKTTQVSSTKAIELIDLPVKANQKEVKIQVQNKNDEVLFARLIATGIPLAGNEIEQSNHLKLDVVYRNMAGSIINVEEIDQGTDFTVEVTVSNPGMRGNYKGLSLSQIFPSGWEIHNQRMDIGYSGGNSNYIEYQDIRDDRVYTYFDLDRNQSKTIKIQLHAAFIGEYYLPSIYIEAMYDNTISALKKGKVVKVVKP